jgi:anti-anti-sigma factor
MTDDGVLTVVPHDKALVLEVTRRALDETSTRELVDEVMLAASQRTGVPIVIDLHRVNFAPSVALGALVQLSKSFKLDQRRIALIGVQDRIQNAIRVTQLYKVLEVHGNLDQIVDPQPVASTGRRRRRARLD